MKILMVNKFLYMKGGSETYMFMLSEYLVKMGHQVQFFGMYDDENIVQKNRDTMISHKDFHMKKISNIIYTFRIIYSIEARKKIKKVIEEFKPDIVHLNNYNFQITPSILYEIKRFKIPTVQTIHDFNIVCPSHGLFNFEKCGICEKCKGRKYYWCFITKCLHNSYAKSCIAMLEAYFYFLLKSYEIINIFVCPSSFMASKLIEFGFDGRKIRRLHNYIADNNQMITKEKQEYILYFGRITPEKGIRTLLKAIKELKHIRFVFAGTGSIVSELQKYDNIEYVGFKTGDELRKLIAESLFTVCPSECYENCPMSVLEAQALGTPVIGSNIGGIPELIDSNSGLLFEAGNSRDLEEKISLLFNNRKQLQIYSNNCKKTVGKFSIQAYYADLMGIYSEALSGSIKTNSLI